MKKPKRLERKVFVPGLVLAWTLLAPSLPGAAPVYALDPDKRLTQYMHKSWRIQDGSLPAGMFSIAQTTDGFLWSLSLPGDLYRFDGVQYLPWPKSADASANAAGKIFADHAGGLWVEGQGLLVHLKDGVVTSHFKLDGVHGFQTMSEDADGSLWVGLRAADAPLCRVAGQEVKCFGKDDGIPFDTINAMLSDGSGGLWLGGPTALVHWRQGSVSEQYPVHAVITSLARAPDGTLRVGMLGEGPGLGLQQVKQGALKPFVTPSFDGSKYSVTSLLVDHDGNLWVATDAQGLFRIHGDAAEHYGHTEGLSGDSVWDLFEDREGIVWAGTTSGIDSFRDPRVFTFSSVQGLGKDLAAGILAGRDGSIWVANAGSLDRIKDGIVSSINSGNGLPGGQVASMLEDRAGNMWVGVDDGLYLFKDGRFRRLPEPDNKPLGMVVGITEDIDGNIWAECGRPRKLVRIRDFQVREVFSDSQVPPGHNLAADPRGGIWIETREGDIVLFHNGVLETRIPLKRVGSPLNRQIIVEADGSVLVGSENGLVGWRAGKLQTMTTKNGLPCDFVIAFIKDQERRWWLYTRCGVVEFADSELQRWWADPETIIQNRVYDAFDGAQPNIGSFNSAATSPDGRVWFSSGVVVQMVDPSHESQKAAPAETYVQSLFVDRKEFAAAGNLKLGPNPRELEINYTSPTLLIPQRVKFRYRLDGYDRDWHDAGTRRQAFYTDLPPGSYTFRVMACNSEGVWNESAAMLDFTIDPAFYQTKWFRLACVALTLALLWSVYRLRVRRLRRQEKRLRDVIEGMPAMAFSVHPDGSPDLVNRRWLDYTGSSADAAAGSRGWEAAVHPDDAEAHLAKWRAALAGGEPFENEARHRGANGEYRWFLVQAVPFRDRRGKILKWYGTLTDIEERKRAEQERKRAEQERERLRRLELELAHTNRLSMLGELTASLAHEINQPISAAITSAGAALRWLNRDQPEVVRAQEAVMRIENDGRRAAEIITHLKSFYKKESSPQRESVAVNEVVGEMLVLLRSEAGRHPVVMRTELASDLPPVRADRVQLQQVLMNLMLNGIEAMGAAGGELVIRTRGGEGEVTVSVSDTGVGIPADRMEQVFNAFFTTKADGTGMGLAISRSIVESHGGRLWAEANPGRGTTFHFTLPTRPEAHQ